MVGVGVDPATARKLDDAWALLTEHSRGSDVAAIKDRLATEAVATPTVVVVGEAKRGKSSLINALLGVPGAAPVGADIVTGAYVAYVPPTVDHELPAGSARIHFADGSSDDVDIAEVADWVTVAGQHAAEERGVAGATVRLPEPGLMDVVLMDTPGVGGLVAGHGHLALRAARDATALLFVSDAGQDFTAPEAAFLEQAAAAVDTVIFAVTKIDKHPVSWRTIVERNRTLLATHIPRFANAPIVGVSSGLAEDALQTDPEVIEALREESRIGELVTALTERVSARTDQLAAANAVRATATLLRAVEAQLVERAAAIKDAEATAELATAEKAALQELKQRQQRWGEDFQLALSRARRTLIADLEAQITELDRDWRARVAGLPDSALREEQRIREMCTALAGALSAVSIALMDRYLGDVTQHISALLAADTAKVRALSDRLHGVVEHAANGETTFQPAPIPGQPFAEQLVRNSFMGFGAANMLGMAISMGAGGIAVLGFLSIPVAAGAALALTFMTHKRQTVEAVRRQLAEHVMKSLTRLRTDVVGRADAAAHELRPELVQAMRDHLRERELQLTQVIREAQEAARAAPMERVKKSQSINRELKAAGAVRAELEASLAREATGSSAGPASPLAKPRASTTPPRRGSGDW